MSIRARRKKEPIFKWYFNYTIYRIVILVGKDYEFDLNLGKFSELLGFEKGVLKYAKHFVGKMLPSITRSVDWIFIHCNLIERRANDVASDVLYSLSTVGLQVSYAFQKEPKTL